MVELKYCGSFNIGSELRGVDLEKVLATYNFSYWFNGEAAWVVLSTDDPAVALVKTSGQVELYGTSCSGDLAEKLLRVLGIKEDLSKFYELASTDVLLTQFAKEFKGWRLRSVSLWWSLVVGICQQNASFRQGWRMLSNIIKLYDRSARAGEHTVLLPPRPQDVLTSPGKLKEAGVGYRAGTILAVARAFLGGDLHEESLRRYTSREIEEELTKIKGVGKYTARLALVLTFRKYDLPPVDRWLKALITEAYGVEEKKAEDLWHRKWGVWAGLASLAVTIALDAVPLRKALNRLRKRVLKPVITETPTPYTMWRFSRL